MARIQPPPGAAGGSGWIRLADAEGRNGDVVSGPSKSWRDAPNNTILESFTASGPDLTLTIFSATPEIKFDGTPFTLPPAADSGHYEGPIDVTVSGAGSFDLTSVTPNGGDGAIDTFTVTLDAPPVITGLSFTGDYPGAQVEVKETDTFDIVVTADKSFNAVRVADLDAGEGDGGGGDEIIAVTPGVGPTIVSITVARRGITPQALPAHVRVVDTNTSALSVSRATNELGGVIDKIDVITLNDLHPTVDSFTKVGAGATTVDTAHAFSVLYPVTQQALKGTEQASVTAAVTDFDSILYSDPTSTEINVAAVTANNVFTSPKVVERVGGTYNVTIDNFQIVATRADNGATITVSGVVQIAAVAPVIDLSFVPARLQSGGNNGTAPQDHLLTLSSSQNLLAAPTLDEDSGGDRGQFLALFAGAGNSWTRLMRVTEAGPNPDEKGIFTFENLVATGLAGIQQTVPNSGGSYELGGWVLRNAAFAAGEALSTGVDVATTDFSRLSVGQFTNGNTGVLQAIGAPDTTTTGEEGFVTIVAEDVDPTVFKMLHTPTVAANGDGITLPVEELP